MCRFKPIVLAALALWTAAVATGASAQVNINIGAPPDCPYGYYDYAPFACSPYGYYGPAWFAGGVFVGAGPWFRGQEGFRGHVNRDFDARFGYRGPFPRAGDRIEPPRQLDRMEDFRGNELRDGRGQSFGGGRR